MAEDDMRCEEDEDEDEDEYEGEESAEEVRYYCNEIKKLIEEKRNKFACQLYALPALQSAPPTSVAGKVKERRNSKRRPMNKKKSKRPIKKKKIQERAPIVSNEVTEQLQQFIAMNYETEGKLVIQKTLFKSDLLRNQNRLNMPMNQAETHGFLTKSETRDLNNGKGMEVQLLGPSLQMHDAPMTLKIWQLKKTKNYVLITNWNNFVEENKEDFKEKTTIQVWSFRKEEKLCFAIACNLERVDGENNDIAVVDV